MEVIVDGDQVDDDPADDIEIALKLECARQYRTRTPQGRAKRIVFRFSTSPVEAVGDDRVEGLRVTSGASSSDEVIETGLVLRSIGNRGARIDGVPFDDVDGRIPNDRGAVVGENGERVAGVYVVGWAKRGPTGVIGTNRPCAHETIASLWKDVDARVLSRELPAREAIDNFLSEHGVEQVDWHGWTAIDAAERQRGRADYRARVKLIDTAEMIAIARG